VRVADEREHHLIYRPAEEGLGDLSVDRLVTAPNIITTVRLLCIPLFVWLLFGRHSHGWAGFVLGSLSATDWVDGYVARRFNQTSNFGKMYDPTVDRLMMVVAIVCILIDGSAPAWFAWTVLAREVIVSLWVVFITARGAKRMDVTWWGKVGAFANMMAFPYFLFAHEMSWNSSIRTFWNVVAYVCAVPGTIFSLLAMVQYFVRGRVALQEGRAEAGH
jgi:cardiolipin synthase